MEYSLHHGWSHQGNFFATLTLSVHTFCFGILHYRFNHQQLKHARLEGWTFCPGFQMASGEALQRFQASNM